MAVSATNTGDAMINPITITYDLAKTLLDPYLKIGFAKFQKPAALICHKRTRGKMK